MMRQTYQVVQHEAVYCLARANGDPVQTPHGRVLSSHNRNYLLFMKRHLNRLGERVDNGMSPYGLAVTYLDFGHDHALHKELCALLADELARDLLLTKPYRPVADALVQQYGITLRVARYVAAIAELNALKLWVLTQYIANYPSVVLGYHLLVEGMNVPAAVAELFGPLLTEQLLAEGRHDHPYSVRALYPELATTRRYIPGATGAVALSRIEQFQRKRFAKRVLWAKQVAYYDDID